MSDDLLKRLRHTTVLWPDGVCDMEHSCTMEFNGAFVIPTLEGELYASVNDWIIRGVKGEFYPCKPDIFAATYEPVEEGDGL